MFTKTVSFNLRLFPPAGLLAWHQAASLYFLHFPSSVVEIFSYRRANSLSRFYFPSSSLLVLLLGSPPQISQSVSITSDGMPPSRLSLASLLKEAREFLFSSADISIYPASVFWRSLVVIFFEVGVESGHIGGVTEGRESLFFLTGSPS